MRKKSLDNFLKKVQKESAKYVSSNRELWEGDTDDIYNVDIHIWRKPGMGNSLQTIAGNKISILTATSSYLQTLLDKEVIDTKELDYMINMVKEQHNNERK